MLLVIIFLIIMVLIEAHNLIKGRYWREFKAFCIIIFFALIILTLYIFNIQVLNPVVIMNYFIKNVLHLNYD
ncbi:hypothetical protein [Clostridium sp. JN-1]|jgi:uncharacterized SAM-binding protein YcdF (DUF218 family)|uniref:hypothetical protein n=1 Tax=Clostridium sp. JN-1 TaxID=2483110 RepID=UPI000F0B8B8A|nr:hypothetical protein [Clostridium sp. JN-1]